MAILLARASSNDGLQYRTEGDDQRLPPGDVGVVRKSLGHYVENTGSEVLQFLEMFRPADTKRSRSPNGSAISRPSW